LRPAIISTGVSSIIFAIGSLVDRLLIFNPKQPDRLKPHTQTQTPTPIFYFKPPRCGASPCATDGERRAMRAHFRGHNTKLLSCACPVCVLECFHGKAGGCAFGRQARKAQERNPRKEELEESNNLVLPPELTD